MKALIFCLLAISCAFGAGAASAEMQRGNDAALASFIFLSCVAGGAAATGTVAILERN